MNIFSHVTKSQVARNFRGFRDTKFYLADNGDPRLFVLALYTTQNLLRIAFSFNDLMLKTNRLKKDFFYKDRLIFGLDDPVANMSIRHVYYA